MALDTKKYLRGQMNFLINARLLVDAWGDMAPVNNKSLPFMKKNSVVFVLEHVYKKMQEIQNKTRVEKIEIPFFLYGKTKGDRVVFDAIDVQTDNLQGAEADFSADMCNKMQNFINSSKKDGSDIVAHGHSHPQTTAYYKMFSRGDLKAYVNFWLDNSVFYEKKIELCSCLLTGGNFNFLFFNGNDFYKHENVLVVNDEGKVVKKLPCYQNEDIITHHNEYSW